MITVYEAYKQAQQAIETALVNVGFANGLDSTVSTEAKTMFWYMSVTDEAAAKKPEYITYRFTGLPITKSGDGQPMVRDAVVELNLYSTHRNADASFEKMNSAFQKFEMNEFTYDNGVERFKHSFIITLQVYEDNE